MRKYDIIGQRFGRWVVLQELPQKGKIRLFFCKCDCGKEKINYGNNLRTGKSLSCGCLKIELQIKRQTVHGLTNSRIYRVWKNIKSRCLNPNSPYFHLYGGNGITLCVEWENDSNNFINWAIDNRYKDNLTIDRIDSSKGYTPKNCRWVDYFVQATNQRLSSRNSSGYRGVSFKKSNQKWVAQVRAHNKVTYIGSYTTPELAHNARIDYLKNNNLAHHLEAYKYDTNK